MDKKANYYATTSPPAETMERGTFDTQSYTANTSWNEGQRKVLIHAGDNWNDGQRNVLIDNHAAAY